MENITVSVFTNLLAPYHIPMFRRISASLEHFNIFLNAPTDPNRPWPAEWGGLPVSVGRSFTYGAWWRHQQGFRDRVWRYIPYDMMPLLFRRRPAVVVSAQLGYRTLQAAIYRKLFTKSRLIVWTALSEHTEKGLPAWRVQTRRILLKCADAVFVNGKSGLNYLLGLGVAREKVFFLPYCADVARNLQLPVGREPNISRRLLYVGQLIERKGLLQFLTVLSDWAGKHPAATCEFRIVGDGPARGQLESLPRPNNLHLTFLGNIAYDKLWQEYAEGGILVFPTLADEWGVVVNEALAAGLPILGSRYSQAVEDLIEEDVTGWTFRPDHAAELSAAIDRALSKPLPELERMRGGCRERIRPLSPEFGAESFLAAVRYVCSL